MHRKLKKKVIFRIQKNFYLENLVDDQKSYLIYKMRNSKLMRNNSINKRKITFNSHKEWFKKFIHKNKIYLVSYNLKYVGYLRLKFRQINKIEISIFIKKKFQNKNIASKILNFALLKYKNYKFIAKVLKSNIVSQNFFRKNNFKSSNKKRKLLIIC